MVCLAKFLQQLEPYRIALKNSGIGWVNIDTSINAFKRIFDNSHENLGLWYSQAMEVLRPNEKLWLKLALVSGSRKAESMSIFNKLIELGKQDKVSECYSKGIFHAYKFSEYQRKTKNLWISVIPQDLVNQIVASQPVSYGAVRKRLTRNKLNLRIKLLRSYYNTYLRNHGVLPEITDLLQGHVNGKSVQLAHYIKVDSMENLANQVNTITENLESSLLSQPIFSLFYKSQLHSVLHKC